MCAQPDSEAGWLLLTADERAALTPAEARLLQAMVRSFTLDELALLTDADVEFFLTLEADLLPEIDGEDAQRVAQLYRERVRAKRAQLSDQHRP